MEDLFTTITIDAYEGYAVGNFDVIRAYLHARLPKGEKIILELRGKFVDIMCDVNPEHINRMIYENGKS